MVAQRKRLPGKTGKKPEDSETSIRVGGGSRVYEQGDPADAVYLIETGRIKISIMNTAGKEAVLAILGDGEFFGEGCMIGQTLRLNAATAQEPSSLIRVEKSSMTVALRQQTKLAQKFIAHLVARNSNLEEDLSDQLFNDSEKRLARVLLKLARLKQQDGASSIRLGKLKHDLLADMVGTTRPRISGFMGKFRKLGLIDYNGETVVRPELLIRVVLRD